MAARAKVFVDVTTTTDKANKGLVKYAAAAGAAALAIGLAVKAGKEWSRAASDAEEIGSKYATIFRDMGSEAERMADDFADSFGLAGSTSRELLGNTADLLTGFGLTQEGAADLSLATNTLAANLASFSNAQGGAAAVSKALTAAYSGERESLKTYGIIITEATLKEKMFEEASKGLTFATEQQAKMSATLAMATEQSANAVGDVARTWDSTANVMRRFTEANKELKEALGVSVNKGLTPFTAAMADLIKQVADGITKSNELKEALDIQAEGGINSQAEMLLILESQRDKLGQIAASYEGLDEAANTAWENAKRNVEYYNESLGITDTFLIKATDTEERRNNVITSNADALEQYAKILQDNMTVEEKKLVYLQTEIDRVVMLKSEAKTMGEEWGGLETLLVELLREKNELLTTEPDIISDIVDVLIPYEATEALINKQLADREALRNTEIAQVEELNQTYVNLAQSGIGAFSKAFKDVGSGNKKLWKGFKDAGKDAVSALLESLGQMAIVQAAIAAASFNFVSAAGYTAAAAGAYTASGYIQTLATGGSFIANQPTPVVVGEGAGSEKVTVEPVSGSSRGGGNERVFASVDGGEGFWMTIQRGMNSGKVHKHDGGRI